MKTKISKVVAEGVATMMVENLRLKLWNRQHGQRVKAALNSTSTTPPSAATFIGDCQLRVSI